jgi:hypothetical protein
MRRLRAVRRFTGEYVSRGRRGPLGVPQRMLFPLTGQGQFFFRPKVAGERKQVQKTTLNILPLPNGA